MSEPAPEPVVMTEEMYEEVSARFQEANRVLNIAKRKAEQDVDQVEAVKEAHYAFFLAKEENDAAYAALAATQADSSLEEVLEDGTRRPLAMKAKKERDK